MDSNPSQADSNRELHKFSNWILYGCPMKKGMKGSKKRWRPEETEVDHLQLNVTDHDKLPSKIHILQSLYHKTDSEIQTLPLKFAHPVPFETNSLKMYQQKRRNSGFYPNLRVTSLQHTPISHRSAIPETANYERNPGL